MITSVKIRPRFEKGYIEDTVKGRPVPLEYRYSSMFDSYPLPALPEGHSIRTDSYLVVFVGDNGTGKTTLLRKLEYQLLWKFEDCIFFGVDSTSNDPKLFICRDEQTSYSFFFRDEEETRRHNEITLRSQGQNKMRSVENFLQKHRNSGENTTLAFDQPEDGVSLRNRRKTVDRISGYAFDNKRQIFVATHEPLFTKVHDALVVNLDDVPASVTKGQDFDLDRYLNSYKTM